MRKHLLCFTLLVLSFCITNAQEYIAVIQSPYVHLLNSETGEIETEEFIDLSVHNPSTPKGIAQVGEEIWITDQLKNVIYRYDLEANFLSQISGDMANIRGLRLINNSEVWVTNATNSGSTPSNSIVQLDIDGNHLGHFTTDGRSPFDVLDMNNGEVLISYSDGGSPIERRDYSGDFIEFTISPGVLNFAQQMWITQDGHLLVSTFSSPSGVYIFDIETGEEIFYSSQSGARGAIQTGDGNILWTNSAGIHLIDMANGGSSSIIKAGSAQFFAMINLDASCITPSLSIEGPDFTCEDSSATLIANTNGELVHWYDSETSTTPIFTGFEFTTPELSENTTYWAQAINYGSEGDGEIIEGGARLAPATNSSSTVNPGTSPWGLTFTTTEAFTINSVDVYLASNSPGDLVVQLLDENWNLIEETTVACPAGNASSPVQFEVPINFSVEAGNTYRLVAASSPEMIREFSSEHEGFPYPIGDVGTVTGGTINNSETNTTVYYFFYNWKVQTGDVETCESERISYTVEVQETPDAPTGDSEQFFALGETLADLTVEASGDLNWYADENGETPLDESTELVDQTTYYVSQTINGCESEVFAITVFLQLSTIDLNTNMFSIYPNPVIDELYINGKNNIQSIEIFDETGRKINQFNGMNNGSINLKDMKPGVYVLRIHADGKVQSFKVIKK